MALESNKYYTCLRIMRRQVLFVMGYRQFLE